MTDPRDGRAPMRRSVLVGLIGEGVGPSLTPPLHELEGARHGMNYVYRPIDIGPEHATRERLEGLLQSARMLGFDGLNITHPVKQAVIPLLDRLAPSAERVGAVNTVKFSPEGMIGHNTDLTGFAAAFDDALGGAAQDRVVLFGAGGAGYAVAAALADRDIAELVIVDAVAERAEHLAQRVADGLGQTRGPRRTRGIGVDQAAELLGSANGVVNATPFGMAAHPGMAFEPARLPAHAWVADIVYRPTETELLRAARARGLRTMSGLGMVAGQAADSFEIFTGQKADRLAIVRDVQKLVAAEATEPA